MLALEFLHEVVDETIVKVFTTQVSITGGSLDFKDTLLDRQKRHIKCTTSKIEDEDVLLSLSLLIETVSNGCGSRFIDDTEDIETSDQSGVFRGLSLGVVEVCGDSDDGILGRTTKICFSGFTHLCENHGRNFLGSEGLCFTLVFDRNNGLATFIEDLERPMLHVCLDFGISESTTDKTFRTKYTVLRVHCNLIFGSIANQPFRVGESDVGWSCSVTLIVCNDFNTIILPNSNTAVSCSKIDTNSLSVFSHYCRLTLRCYERCCM